MAAMEMKIQTLLLPTDERFDSCRGLFFSGGGTFVPPGDRLNVNRRPRHVNVPVPIPWSGDGVSFDYATGAMRIAAGTTVSFCTYFNSCSIGKWLGLTMLESIRLRFRISGDFEVVLTGYSASRPVAGNPYKARLVQQGLGRSCHRGDGARDVAIDIPATDASVVGFELRSLTDCELFGGEYVGLAHDFTPNNVDICLVSTTFKKEAFITRNIAALRQGVWESGSELARHLDMIVVDNGQTLDAAALSGEHVRILPNRNVGGAGGFARGMIEALRGDAGYTHLVLMDDDVLLLPESLERLYALLRVLKPEYAGRFISGAMLQMEHMSFFYEDVGYLDADGGFKPQKNMRNMCDVRALVQNEEDWPGVGRGYAGWWFCCIPMRYVSESSLPLPLFVRGDDAEFAIRNDPGFITMNGLCVWHMGFSEKFNAALEYYQVVRNTFIVKVVSGACGDVDVYGRVKGLWKDMLYEYQYDYADLLLDAVEDYLKGPEYLVGLDGAEVLRVKAKANERLVPLTSLGQLGIPYDVEEVDSLLRVYEDGLDAPWNRVLRHNTWMGHVNAERGFFYRDFGTTPYDLTSTLRNQQGARTIVAIDPRRKTGTLRHIDTRRFEECRARAEVLFADYDARHVEVEREWREAYPTLTSIGFWKEYLGQR